MTIDPYTEDLADLLRRGGHVVEVTAAGLRIDGGPVLSERAFRTEAERIIAKWEG